VSMQLTIQTSNLFLLHSCDQGTHKGALFKENSMEEDMEILYTSSFWSPVYRRGDKVLEAETVFWGNTVTSSPSAYTLAWHLISACV